MPWRVYTIDQKYTKRDGTISYYKVKNKKRIKSNRYKPQKRGFEKKSIYSKRFGYLDLYNREEQRSLICPSGYSISQCFNVLSKLWFGYKRAMNSDKSIEKMVKYAKGIQSVQKDMGIETASFPHLGLYGDSLILYDKKRNRLLFEDHSALKKKQQEYEKWMIENSKKIEGSLHKPKEGQHVEIFADDKYPYEVIDCEPTVPELLIPDEEKGQSVIIFPDLIPFRDQLHRNDFENQTSE